MCKNKNEITATVNIHTNLNGFNRKLFSSYNGVMEILNILYQIGLSSGEFQNSEAYFYNKILDVLNQGVDGVDGEARLNLIRQIEILKTTHFDMTSLSYTSSKSKVIELVLGKVISPELNNKKMYGGVLGIHNREVQEVIDGFDDAVGRIYEKGDLKGCTAKNSFSDVKSIFSCLEVLNLAGELNRKNKPISVFYSGTEAKNIAALPNVVVFTNLYLSRFKSISLPLGNELLTNLETSADDLLVKLLVCWLRGHDLGHVFGVDNLGREMKNCRTAYYILHELKSDIVALALLLKTGKAIFRKNVSKELFSIFLCEMFRYIRKGNFAKFPDSGSAYLALNYFLEMSVISKSSESGVYSINFDLMPECIVEFAEYLFILFESGDGNAALNFTNKYGDLGRKGFEKLNRELPALFLSDVPDNIGFNFINSLDTPNEP